MKLSTQRNIPPKVIWTTPWRLSKVDPLKNYQLAVTFLDETHGIVSIKSLIMNHASGVFAQLKDPSLFSQVYLEFGVVTWPGGVDLSPDAMYDEIKKNGQWVVK